MSRLEIASPKRAKIVMEGLYKDLHESSIYNITQTTIASVAVFTGGMNSGFNKAANSAGVKPSCLSD